MTFIFLECLFCKEVLIKVNVLKDKCFQGKGGIRKEEILAKENTLKGGNIRKINIFLKEKS